MNVDDLLRPIIGPNPSEVQLAELALAAVAGLHACDLHVDMTQEQASDQAQAILHTYRGVRGEVLAHLVVIHHAIAILADDNVPRRI